MKNKIRQRVSRSESARQRKLELSRETVRTLGESALSHVVGGSVCDTSSYTTEKIITSKH